MRRGPRPFSAARRRGGWPAGEGGLCYFPTSFAPPPQPAAASTPPPRRPPPRRGGCGDRPAGARGVRRISPREREVQRITLPAPATEPRRVLVEIAKDGDRTLSLEGGPIAYTEETATAWRLPVSLRAGEVRTMTANIDRLQREETALLGNDAEVVVRLLNDQTLAAPARAALQRLAALRQDEATKRATVAQIKAQQAAISQDEDRIRKNLAAVAANDALHARLTRALE